MKNNKNKVAIISSSLGIGGAERFASNLSFILHDLDFEVHSIIINNKVDYQYKGTLFNLGLLCKNDLIKKFKKSILLKKYIENENIAIIIDNRTRLFFIRDLIYRWIYNKRNCFFMIHSSKLELYLPKSVFLSKILYSKKDTFICVSNEIEKKVQTRYFFKNTLTIYNSVKINNLKFIKPNNVSEKYFLYFGRFDEKVKNLTLMMESFLLSKVYEVGFQLILMGSGPDLELINEKVKQLKCEDYIKIIPFVENPIPYIQQAKSTVLTSRFEGFPMSIIESLAVGTPVISVDCPTGPNEMIIDKFNGLLVENYNKNQIAEAFKKFAFDDELYQICKLNSQKSIEHLSVETIANQWKKLLNNYDK